MSKKSSPRVLEQMDNTVEIKKTDIASPKKPQQTVNNKGPKKKGKRDWSFYAIIICLIVLAIPSTILGYTLISASLSSRKPLFGDRFDGHYDNVIDKTQKADLTASLSEIEGVGNAKVELISGTLRLYLSAPEAGKDSFEAIANTAYDKTLELLPLDSYFKKDESFRRYDLEIHVFNFIDKTDENKDSFVYLTGIKTSSHEAPIYQFVSDPISQEFVDELWAIQAERDKPKEEIAEEPEEVVGDEENID